MRKTDPSTMRGLLTIGLVVSGLFCNSMSAQTPQAPAAGRGPQVPPLMMTSSAWEDGGVIPDKYTQAAGPAAVSPELKWSQVPPGTQSFVLLLHDPGAGAQQGLEDGHHALADLEHSRHVDRACRKASRRASCRTAAVRSAFARTPTWVPARRPARTITTRSSCTRSTRSSTCRRARRSRPPTRAWRSSTRWTATCSVKRCSSHAFTGSVGAQATKTRRLPNLR